MFAVLPFVDGVAIAFLFPELGVFLAMLVRSELIEDGAVGEGIHHYHL